MTDGPEHGGANEHGTPEPRDARSRADDLERMAREASEATWGESEHARARVPGLLSGDVGPKGKVSAQLRDLSRAERASRGEVPHGGVAPGSFGLLLLPMVVFAMLLLGVVVLLGWLLS